jgi:hypothetical protein
MTKTLQQMIEQAPVIRIVSGEGDNGAIKAYRGKRTARALRAHLTRERCGGDRWARAEYKRTDSGLYDTLLGNDD